EALAPHVQVFSLATLPHAIAESWSAEQWREHVRAVRTAAPSAALLLVVPPDLDPAKVDELLGPALAEGVGGVAVAGGGAAAGGRLTGEPAREPGEAQVRRLRQRWGEVLAIVGSGGVHEPEQALRLLEAGADLVAIDSGLVYGGPG